MSKMVTPLLRDRRITWANSHTISGAKPWLGSSRSVTLKSLNQRAGDRQHLLPTARKLCALVAGAHPKRREQLEQARERPGSCRPALGDLDVLDHGQIGKMSLPSGT
jgi:hypothetical protein